MRSPFSFEKGGPRGALDAVLLGEPPQGASPSPLTPEFRPGKAGPKFHRFILGLVPESRPGKAGPKFHRFILGLVPESRPGKAGPKFHRFILGLVMAVVLASGAGGCAVSKWTVKPHQRELLADRIMQLDAEGQERAAEEHILSNREGAVGGTGTSGGGCGCN